jgi:CDP-diacylglycerol--glycerol-3-phosphate 3-phosphatidyltransferase
MATIPVIVLLLVPPHSGFSQNAAFIVYCIASLTDYLDGILARRFNTVTSVGKLLDPLADKFLLSGAFLVLAFKGVLGWWLTILVLARDVIILATGAVIVLVVGPRTFPPSIFGKLTTALQILLILEVIATAAFSLAGVHELHRGLVYAVAASTVFSGVHYSVTIARRLHSP